MTEMSYNDESRLAIRTWLRLLACTNLIEGKLRAGLRDKFDTTLPRFDVLAQLDAVSRESKRGLTMSELSRRLMVTNGNLTGLVERLEREKLVTRASSAKDGRRKIVKLTPEGKMALDTMLPDHQTWIDSMFEPLSHDERVQLHALLGKLKDSVEQPQPVQNSHD